MDDGTQVKALKEAILQRARELAEEHINQGKLVRNRIMQEARDKVQLMEKKELLAAKDNADREYHRQVQASELRMQAELDRNRWGLVQSVMDNVSRRVGGLADDARAYRPIFLRLLEAGIRDIGLPEVVVEINSRDRKRYADQWQRMMQDLPANITLSQGNCECSGGMRIYSGDGDQMVDNTFDGIIARRDDELMRAVFERLFSKMQGIGVSGHG